MPRSLPPYVRLALVAAGLSLLVAACGRRGPLEPPPDPSAPKEEKAEPGGGSMTPSPIGTPKKQPRATSVPNEPFILDPLL
ncbi:lipoprotein [Chelatococcus sp. SYSU_G07232]|uniref:Lipoprotein n=1 Tax=Chelatococcus albus TaxID=3047466 RepID=A0ABT7ALV5_9HYPH|nr:lipoprotein [Chelatococcus sp. SYSU_G07232]MDJ1159566.1 lipoprotein [Chelatococcus sp. SYSU_G07232]